MSDLETLRLTLNPGEADERQYQITMIQDVEIRTTKDAFSIAPPGLAAAENILLGVSGMNADISITFMAHDDGTDKANGTHSSTVVTVEEQLHYLEHDVHAPDFDAHWQLDHVTGDAFNGDEVFMETSRLNPISRDSPKWKETVIELRRGGSV